MAGIMASLGCVLVGVSLFVENAYCDWLALGWTLLTAGAYLIAWRTHGKGEPFLGIASIPRRPACMGLWLVTASILFAKLTWVALWRP